MENKDKPEWTSFIFAFLFFMVRFYFFDSWDLNKVFFPILIPNFWVFTN